MTPFHLLPPRPAFSAVRKKDLTPLTTTYLCRSVRREATRAAHSSARGVLLTERYFASHHISHKLPLHS